MCHIIIEFLPIIFSAFISFVFSKVLRNKKDKLEIMGLEKKLISLEQKDKLEIKKLEEEIKNLKSSNRPFIFASLHKINNVLLPKKMELLENLLIKKRDFFHFENIYDNEGNPIVDDIDDYYFNIAENVNKTFLNDFEKNISIVSYYFNKDINSKILELGYQFNVLYDNNLQQNAMKNEDFNKRKMINCVKKIEKLFEEAIESLRKDLQADNQYIQKFLEYYKDIE